jgi:class I fructose-bisphosphate aldolase
LKAPADHLELDSAKKVHESEKIDIATLTARVQHVVQSAFNGRRMTLFSGGAAKDLDGLLNEIRAIRDGGATGSIIGRNTFQRPRNEALNMLDTIINIYKFKA